MTSAAWLSTESLPSKETHGGEEQGMGLFDSSALDDECI